MLHLSAKQKTFLKAYLPPVGRFNATQAARTAGYSWPNKAGPRVSNSPKIAPQVDAWFYGQYRRYMDDAGKWVYKAPDLSKFGR